MGDEALGVVTPLMYSAALDNPANKKFVAAYTKFAGKIPGYYSAMNYTAAHVIVSALRTTGGAVEEKQRFVDAMKSEKISDDPRGPLTFDAYGNPVENIYIRKVERVGGQLQNTVIHTYPNVSQFWTYTPEAFLKHPVYDRDNFPGCKYCS